jgi:TetR/AcrR family transcriptional regulator
MNESRRNAERREGVKAPVGRVAQPKVSDASPPQSGGSGTRGRTQPKVSDARTLLLREGRKLFARKGFKGTSIRALTTGAGVNLGAVTYHFGSKEGLYHAVLEDCLGPVRERIGSVGEVALPAMDRVDLAVRGLFRHLQSNPDLPRFLVQELVLGERLSPPVLDLMRTVVGTLARIMEEGQAEGSMVSGDPVFQALSVLSQPIYLSVMPAALQRESMKGADLPLPSGSAEDHAVALLGRGLSRRQEEE